MLCLEWRKFWETDRRILNCLKKIQEIHLSPNFQTRGLGMRGKLPGLLKKLCVKQWKDVRLWVSRPRKVLETNVVWIWWQVMTLTNYKTNHIWSGGSRDPDKHNQIPDLGLRESEDKFFPLAKFDQMPFGILCLNILEATDTRVGTSILNCSVQRLDWH